MLQAGLKEQLYIYQVSYSIYSLCSVFDYDSMIGTNLCCKYTLFFRNTHKYVVFFSQLYPINLNLQSKLHDLNIRK